MSFHAKVIAAAAEWSVFVCLLGLFVSGRWRLCYSFTAYCVAILGLEIPYQWLGYFNWPMWMGKQAIFDAIKLIMCLELGLRVLEPFPLARAKAARWAFFAMWTMLVSCVYVLRHPGADGYLFAASELHARAVIACVYLLTIITGAAMYYGLIVHPFHKGLLLSFGMYLAAFGVLLRLFLVKGWLAHSIFNNIDPKAYAVFALSLAFLSWRASGPDEESYQIVVDELKERAA